MLREPVIDDAVIAAVAHSVMAAIAQHGWPIGEKRSRCNRLFHHVVVT